MKLLHYIGNLFFPEVCASCGTLLLKGEETVCLSCRYLLPKTGYELNPLNPLARAFFGQMPFKMVTSEFFFSKGGKVQRLIHGLKYDGCKENGIFLGRETGKSLKNAPAFNTIDYLVPIPLHPKKERKRGYNQSRVIAEGINAETGIPIAERCLVRKVHTATQTKKSREERWENVKDIFEVADTERFKYKHVLLIDDVLTTGATLLSAGKALLEVEGILISAATVACAGN
ncbi:MAG: ComF family protein [Candidatus Limimorpha sp.]